ncbi:MAG TPA: S8 family serine peptidase [Acidimicrobiales bacterium]|nr:S8 family serine peptidase [Acidimicrobiales bacterium]
MAAVTLVGALVSMGVAHAAPGGVAGATGRYIVVLHEGVDPDQAAADHRRAHGASPQLVYRHALRGYGGTMSAQAAANIARDPRVAFVEADQLAFAFGHGEVTTGVDRSAAPDAQHVVPAHLTIDGVDDLRVDVDVAVIDTGADHTHPDLNVVAGTNCSGGSPFKQSCSDGFPGDDNGHGTHVSGTIGALDNGVGVVGMAPGARIHAVKVLRSDGSGYMSWIVAGIDWVTARAPVNGGPISVANMSLGCKCSSGALDSAISGSVGKGVVYVVAAGNSNEDVKDYSPAKHPDVITVSALADFDGVSGGTGAPTCRNDQDDTLADFSNWGNGVDLAAPGVCIRSTVPGGGYDTWSGTSMAAPHVAGAAALITSQGAPTTKAQALAVRDTLVQNGNLTWTDGSGDGIKEPLLDVTNATVFTPTTTSGSGGSGGGGGGETNTTPVVTIDSPLDNSVFDEGTSITFSGTATDTEDGVLTTNLVWSSNKDGQIGSGASFSAVLSVGTHTVTATATDSDGAAGSSSITLAVNSTSGSPTSVVIDSITYTWYGGRYSNNHLDIAIVVKDDLGNPLAGVSVTVQIRKDGLDYWQPTGNTDSNGRVVFTIKNAPSDCYTADVLSVTGTTLTYDGTEPANQSCKSTSASTKNGA